jgi:hypothetical protein
MFSEFSFCLSMMWFSLSGCSYCSFFLKFWGDFIVPYNFCRSGGFLCSWTIPSCLGLCTLALPCYVLLADWFGAARSAMPDSVLQIHFDVFFFARKGAARSAILISISCWGTLFSYVVRVPHSRVRQIKIGRWMAFQRDHAHVPLLSSTNSSFPPTSLHLLPTNLNPGQRKGEWLTLNRVDREVGGGGARGAGGAD